MQHSPCWLARLHHCDPTWNNLTQEQDFPKFFLKKHTVLKNPIRNGVLRRQLLNKSIFNLQSIFMSLCLSNFFSGFTSLSPFSPKGMKLLINYRQTFKLKTMYSESEVDTISKIWLLIQYNITWCLIEVVGLIKISIVSVPVLVSVSDWY